MYIFNVYMYVYIMYIYMYRDVYIFLYLCSMCEVKRLNFYSFIRLSAILRIVIILELLSFELLLNVVMNLQVNKIFSSVITFSDSFLHLCAN